MKIRRPHPVLTATISGALVLGALAGCSAAAAESTSAAAADSETGTSTTTTVSDVATAVDDALSDNEDYTALAAIADETWDPSTETTVSLDGDSATVSGDGATADGSTVTISAPGTYRISGTLDDGQVVVSSEADGVVRLVLDGADITSSTGSAIAITQADDVSVVLEDGSVNSLTDASTYADITEDAPTAALFSSDAMVISGTGSLDVTGNYNDGIASKDGLVIADGDITVTAVDDGVRGKDFLVVTGGTINVDATGDGLKADNEDGVNEDGETVGYAALLGGEVTVASDDDGVHAESELVIDAATVTVTEAVEGLESAHILVAGGMIDVTSSDDGFNAAGGGGGSPQEPEGDFSIVVTGGDVRVDSGGDSLDSNGTLTISGGDVTVFGPETGVETGLDSTGAMTLNGGTVYAVGAASKLQMPNEGSQGWVAASFAEAVSAGTELSVVDASGTVVATQTLPKDTLTVIVAAPNVTSGAEYTVQADGAVITTVTAGVAPERTGGGGGGRP